MLSSHTQNVAMPTKNVFMNNEALIRENIKKCREQRDLTQAEMAEKLAMSLTGYAKIEQGKTGLDAKRLYQIAHALDVGLWDLVPNTTNDGMVVFNNSNDNFSNSTHFSLSFGNVALESENQHLRYVVEAKNELLEARDREIESLKSQIVTLQKVIATLENT